MEKRPKSENELIQEGLERFLEQELKNISARGEQEKGEVPYHPSEHMKTDSNTIQMIDLERTGEGHRGQQGFAEEDRNGLDLDFEERHPERNTNVPRNINSNKTVKEAGRTKTGKIENRKTVSKKGDNRKSREKNMPKNEKDRSNKKKKKKFSGWKKLVVFLAVLFLAGMAGLYAIVGSIYDKMDYEEVQSYSKEPMKENGVVNILLIGNDSRENGEDGRSDAMILISISDKTRTITMTSLLRDMYVEIPGHDGNRLNAAYSYGGPELLMQTIEQNFDIEVHRYALVNFQAFAKLVDAVGGVDLELSNEEVNYVNGYLVEYNMLEGRPEGTDYLDTSLSGMIHLNGPQALAYTRNRYIGTDFGRTERQRKVLAAAMKKMPGTLAVNSGEVIDGLFPNLTTNLTKSECFGLSLNGSKFLTYELVQQAIPAEGTYSNATIRSMSVLQVDFEANKKILQESIYGK
ncbi:MAG: LCP family protein [Lachnospiraceae bacterium]|nr:LCP family protein [Lachnospiraceae bacterium]